MCHGNTPCADADKHNARCYVCRETLRRLDKYTTRTPFGFVHSSKKRRCLERVQNGE